MTELANKLLAMKEKMKQLDDEISLTTGKLSAYMEQLNNEWDCTSIDDANVLSQKIYNNIEELRVQKQELLSDLENKHGWLL